MNLCSSAVNTQRLFPSQKSWWEMFVLKLSGIQILFLNTGGDLTLL